jgi:hypothetical protein
MLGLTSKTVVLRSFKYLSKRKEAAPVKVKNLHLVLEAYRACRPAKVATSY